MSVLKLVFICAIAFVCTFAWLWRLVIEAKTARSSSRPLWPPFEFSARYVADVLQRAWLCLVGLVIAAITIFMVAAVTIFIVAGLSRWLD